MHYAIESKYFPLCEDLVNYGADTNISDSGGKTALYLASELGSERLCNFLILRGAHVNGSDEDKAPI